MRPLARPISAAAILALIATGASAQTDDERFRPIEPGFEDVSPNAVRNRMYPVDLRTPSGFERVYEITDAPDLLARRHGGVTAVFARSEYAGDATPLVPAGTVFYIGSVPVMLSQPGVLASPAPTVGMPASPVGMAMRVNRAVDQRVERRTEPAPPTPAYHREAPRSIFESEAYRRARIGQILDAARWNIRAFRNSSISNDG